VIPIGDFIRTRSRAYVNWALIAANIAVFVYTITLSTEPNEILAGSRISPSDHFLISWGLVPSCLQRVLGQQPDVSPRLLAQVCPSGNGELLRLITSMFVHAGWLHIAGNMLFLWIFGDNVEDSMGHLRYLLFYVICGLVAAATQTLFTLDTIVPAVGASGAIAGVLAAYLITYPKSKVEVIILPLFFWPFFVPAIVLIGFWFATQVFSGVMSIGQATTGSGVAFWAHVGGFIAGAILVWFFRQKERLRPRPEWRIGSA
jgi:membrane associated rhomboid family serine protease